MAQDRPYLSYRPVPRPGLSLSGGVSRTVHSGASHAGYRQPPRRNRHVRRLFSPGPVSARSGGETLAVLSRLVPVILSPSGRSPFTGVHRMVVSGAAKRERHHRQPGSPSGRRPSSAAYRTGCSGAAAPVRPPSSSWVHLSLPGRRRSGRGLLTGRNGVLSRERPSARYWVLRSPSGRLPSIVAPRTPPSGARELADRLQRHGSHGPPSRYSAG